MTLRAVADSTPTIRASARVRRIAELLDEAPSQIRRMVARGDLEAHRVGKRGIRIYLDSVEHWQQTHGIKPTTAAARHSPPQPHQPAPATRAAHRSAVAELRRLGVLT